MSLLLAACSTATKEKVIVKNVPILFPSHLASDCTVPKPPEKEAYLKADQKSKEGLWAESMMKHYRAERECNIRLGALREWREEQLRIYNVQGE